MFRQAARRTYSLKPGLVFYFFYFLLFIFFFFAIFIISPSKSSWPFSFFTLTILFFSIKHATDEDSLFSNGSSVKERIMYFFTNRGNQFGRGAVRETRASPRKDAVMVVGKGPPDDVDLAAQKAHASFATGMGRGSLDSAHRAIVEDLSTDLEDSASKVCPVAGALEGFTSAGRCSRCLDQKVVINVSGARYITHLSVLNRYPESLLGDPHQRAR